ncbi:PP2C family protein-serine/threonine phosphatase [Ilumatobacter sp.]|uniref:PP2C family protein-serine/threonine phosphatase n=1 Tax=Ilumatobacter sp. TaxID=1967498 RepID=UPI003B52ED6A
MRGVPLVVTADPTGSDDRHEFDAIVALVEARDAHEVVGLARAMLPGDARLYVVDNGYRELVELPPDGSVGTVVELSAELRGAMLSSVRVLHDGSWWVPLPDRGHSLFVVRLDGDEPGPVELARVAGSLLPSHLRRFDDLERARRRDVMSVAAEVQRDVLPARSDHLGDYDVAGILEPAYTVAGDVFDYVLSDGSVWAYSLDGMGHGTEATISSILTMGAIRTARRSGADLAEQMRVADRVVHEQFGGDRFVTAAGCRLGPDAVEVVNAGHEPLRTIGVGRSGRLALDSDMPLGVTGSSDYRVHVLDPLRPGEAVVMMSDGAVGARSADGAQFGADRLESSFVAHWSPRPFDVVNRVMEDVLEHVGASDVGDDITAVMVMRRQASASPPAP